MPIMLDARIPLRFALAPEGADDSALLIEGDAPAPAGRAVARFHLPAAADGHPPACACCVPAGPAADALRTLFLARARGSQQFFREVIVLAYTPAGEAAVRSAVADDPLASARYRLRS
jgi:hypothetical protein